MTDEKSGRTIGDKRPAATLSAVLAGAFFTTGAALASGSLPPEPLSAGPFANFAACLAYLESTHREQSAMAMPEPVTNPAGGTRQIRVYTNGVSQKEGEQATYEAEVGYEFRHVDAERRSIITNYTWERYSMACHGAVFDGTLDRGYALPGTAPAP
ncbi:hypothetical protein [Rhizobium sp. P28RR-XV]|uniref:hypothetical protein n=1 Tax=Rhizobium sp. P28RR-XV TaxID=2726737 RepID=UPI0014563DF6|nr:hypothetical protein [Rhizobium sp. P28RR-XV]NLR89455.1 hypothetical protein [Rhizobium sp. P28RR-XV]